MIKLIVFDWDDVFTTGSTAAYHACYFKAAIDAGSSVSKKKVKNTVNKLWGRPHEDVIRSYLDEEPELFTETNKNYEKYIHTDIFLNNLEIVEGSIEMLERLSTAYTLAIVSGINPNLLKEKVFPKFNVPKVFEKIITSYDLDDRSSGKPHPDMLNMVLISLDIQPENTILIGDAPGDMKMAQAAGVTPIAVLTGQLTKEEAGELNIIHVMNNVTELEELINNLE
jgi:phosphoglycolate phosphatase